MNRKRIFAFFRTTVVLVAIGLLLSLSLNYYLRLAPLPELQFISNDGWDFDDGCRKNVSLENGKEQISSLCNWRLRSHSVFQTAGDNVHTVQWCNQEVLKKMQSEWDIDWHFVRFNYSHSVPLWSDGCDEEVIIETDIYLQVALE